jgi:multicomponent K+:H+ antiporter subunit D
MTLIDHLSVAPVVIPAIVAPVTMLVMRRRRVFSLILSLGGCVAMLAAACALFGIAQDDAIRSYALGAWVAPFGIVLVVDRLAATMLVLAAVLALVVLPCDRHRCGSQGLAFPPNVPFPAIGVERRVPDR